jgi:DNA-binding SARP family transcriptional activator
VSTRVHLLGSPRIERDGNPLPGPRGNKTWGLLVYLICTRLPTSRERIAGLLFPEADDPLGALRWTLSDLRRVVGPSFELGGEPLHITRVPGTVVDVDLLHRGSWREALELPGLGHELLDGLTFSSSAGFELWLESERRHVAGAAGAVLHEAALALLAYGDAPAAARRAAQLVELNRFDENAHALLVACLRRAGDVDGAARQIAACEELFRRELGIDPSPAVGAAGLERTSRPGALGTGRAAVLAQIETGEAILAAGSADAGLERLRSACASARAGDDPELLARALIALGGVLVHGARGTDEEGTAALHEGVLLAERAGHSKLAATGWREIAWVQFLRAEYGRAEESVSRTTSLAGDDDEEMGWADVIVGTGRMDVGDYTTAGRLLRSSVERSRRTDAAHLQAFALSMLGRYHLARGEVASARVVFDDALALVELRGLTAFRPWPEAFRGEIDLIGGDVATARERFEHAFAVGCEVGDPCWESIAMRGLGLVAVAEGDVTRGIERLLEAPRLCRRLPDTYSWIEVYGLDALCAVGLEHGADSVAVWIDELAAVTARRGMREYLLHATVYRARLGDPGASSVARSLASQVDNPGLSSLLDFPVAAAPIP